MKAPSALDVLKRRTHPLERSDVKRVSFDMLRDQPSDYLDEPLKLSPAQQEELDRYRCEYDERMRSDD